MEEKRFTLDRYEEGYAVLIDNDANTLYMERAEIPHGAKEGDALLFNGEFYTIDYEYTAKRRDAIKSRFERLKKKTNRSED